MNKENTDSPNILASMQAMYEVFPYPNRPKWVQPDPTFQLLSHAAFPKLLKPGYFKIARSLWDLSKNAANILQTHRRAEFRSYYDLLSDLIPKDEKILLVGCGTDEPLLYRALHPKTEIVGIDLSEKSIRIAKEKIKKWMLRRNLFPFEWLGDRRLQQDPSIHTFLLAGDAGEVLHWSSLGPFDFVQCYGVLHHQPEPKAFLEKITPFIKKGGHLRLMFYTKSGRKIERHIQRRYQKLWDDYRQQKTLKHKCKIIAEHAKLLLWKVSHVVKPNKNTSLRFRYLNFNRSSVADALMHPSDPGLEPHLVEQMLSELGYDIVFCEAKHAEEGWMVGFEDTKDAWKKILNAEHTSNIISNITLIAKKRV